jgi:RNA polymerase sigma-70 factor (ECF subfamily)
MCSSAVAYGECALAVSARDSEESLVVAAIQGDAAAFETLALRYKRIVMAITRRMTGSGVEAEDLTQQAFMKAFANISRFGGRSSFSTWLISIAMNEARMWLRKARNSREIAMSEFSTGDSADVPLDFMDCRPGPEASYSQMERSRLLFSELERLKPETRAALQFCDLEEQSSVEAAVVLGITANGVKSRRLRGRAILRKRLEASFTPAKQHHRAGKAVRSQRSPRIPQQSVEFLTLPLNERAADTQERRR